MGAGRVTNGWKGGEPGVPDFDIYNLNMELRLAWISRRWCFRDPSQKRLNLAESDLLAPTPSRAGRFIGDAGPGGP